MLTIEQAIAQRHDTAPWPSSSSPWGHIQTATHIAEGIIMVHTASHGGMHLSADRLAKMPACLLKPHHNYCPFSWFEEDCEVALVMLAFPDDFTADEYNGAVETLYYFYPINFAAWTASLAPAIPQDALALLVERLHAKRYPTGCPNSCEACQRRLHDLKIDDAERALGVQ